MAMVAKVMVKIKCSLVFNGIFEMQKSTRIEKENAKMRVFGTPDPRVYHTGINHGAALREIYSSLTPGMRLQCAAGSPRSEGLLRWVDSCRASIFTVRWCLGGFGTLKRSSLASQPYTAIYLRSLGCYSYAGQLYWGERMPDELGTPRTKADDTVQSGAPQKKFKAPIVTLILLAILIAVYVAETLPAREPTLAGSNTNGSILILLGGVNRTDVIDNGQWFRLVTATFLHANLLHLLMNGIVLLFCGALLETQIGRAWYLALYTASGLAGSGMSLTLNDPNINSVGASGAIMGVLAGAFVGTFRYPERTQRLRVQANLLRLLIPALVPRAAGLHIDVSAHMGGAIAGAVLVIVIMFIWEEGAPQPKFQRAAMAIPLLALPVFLIGLRSGIAQGAMLQAYSAERRGQLALADNEFTRAIQFDARSDDAFAGRALIRFLMKRFSESAGDFRVLVDLRPGWGYAPLFLHVARLHAQEDDREELARNASSINLDQWPGPALALFLDRTTPEAVQRAAANAETARNEHQTCEASFYIGEWMAMGGSPDQGAPLLRIAADRCPLEFVERKLAMAELEKSQR
jgi:membrane associated rhomboid family serine protease